MAEGRRSETHSLSSPTGFTRERTGSGVCEKKTLVGGGVVSIPFQGVPQCTHAIGVTFLISRASRCCPTCYNTSSWQVLEGSFKDRDEDGGRLSHSHDS